MTLNPDSLLSFATDDDDEDVDEEEDEDDDDVDEAVGKEESFAAVSTSRLVSLSFWSESFNASLSSKSSSCSESSVRLITSYTLEDLALEAAAEIFIPSRGDLDKRNSDGFGFAPIKSCTGE